MGALSLVRSLLTPGVARRLSAGAEHPIMSSRNLAAHDANERGVIASPVVNGQRNFNAARAAFVAVTATYCLGVYNDNFYKESSMLLAVAAGQKGMQGALAIAFIAPYVLAAAPAGWAADRFSKRTVVLAAKTLELIAMLVGAYAIITLSWPLVLVMAFTMGLQATVFSPAMNGSLPELFPEEEQLTSANSVLKGGMVAAVLAGIALAGVLLEHGGAVVRMVAPLEPELAKRVAVAVCVVVIAVIGLLTCFWAPASAAANPKAPFPWSGPVNSFRDLLALRSDPDLWLMVVIGAFVWSLGSLEAMLVNPLGRQELGLGETATASLLGAQMIGIGVGGGLSGLLTGGERFRPRLAPILVALAGSLAAMVLVPFLPAGIGYWVALLLLTVHGVLGGVLLIPCEAFVQARPAPEKRGTVIAAYGFLFGGGIVATGALEIGLNWLLPPSRGFVVVGLLTLMLLLLVRRIGARSSTVVVGGES